MHRSPPTSLPPSVCDLLPLPQLSFPLSFSIHPSIHLFVRSSIHKYVHSIPCVFLLFSVYLSVSVALFSLYFGCSLRLSVCLYLSLLCISFSSLYLFLFSVSSLSLSILLCFSLFLHLPFDLPLLLLLRVSLPTFFSPISLNLSPLHPSLSPCVPVSLFPPLFQSTSILSISLSSPASFLFLPQFLSSLCKLFTPFFRIT